MFDWWRNRRSQVATASEIYGAIVARARNPGFYRRCGVSDTPEGRYELIVLTMSLVLERLRQLPGAAIDLQRLIIEAFVTDMDDCMREMGVGDLTVPKKVKRAAAGLMERMDLYRSALAAADDSAIQAALEANIPAVASTPGAAALLAISIRADIKQLAGLTRSELSSGKLKFSDEPAELNPLA